MQGKKTQNDAENACSVQHTAAYLRLIGVPELPPLTSPFDPGYDFATFKSHLDQSSHLMSIVKISMACWIIANEEITRQKIVAASKHGVPTVTGGGPFEIAVAQDLLPAYLDLCADIGVTRIECGEGFTDLLLEPGDVIRLAEERRLEVQFELGKKHTGAFQENEQGNLNCSFADRFAKAFGLGVITFEAPNKQSQFALLDCFGHDVHLSNVRLEELLRVEIYRRGLHSDAFRRENLRPARPATMHATRN